MSRAGQPVFWMPLQQGNTIKRWTDHERKLPNGLIERGPIQAHVGDDYEDRVVHPRAHQRSVQVVRPEGHVVPWLLTNAAADLNTTSTYAVAQRLKARAIGAYLLTAPLCRQLKEGSVRKDRIVAKEILASKKLCAKGVYPDGCPCSKKERAARIAAHVQHEQLRDAAYTDQALKTESAIATAAAKGVGGEIRAALGELATLLKGGK